jgi:anti-sigma regulatory factor (Ser/Thr protein kinase)
LRTWRLDLDSDVHTARTARHSARSWLSIVDCREETKTDIIIVVSELVAHAAIDSTRISLTIVFDDGRLRVDVHAQHHQTDTVTRGRPLAHDAPGETLTDRVVAAATDAWGRTRTPHGTHTWAEILC